MKIKKRHKKMARCARRAMGNAYRRGKARGSELMIVDAFVAENAVYRWWRAAE